MIEQIVKPDGSIYFQSAESEKFHRPNGPAIQLWSGEWDWFLFGRYHRYYGSQCYYTHDDSGEWWIHGKHIR